MRKANNIFSFGGVPYMNGKEYAKQESKKNLYIMTPDDYIAKSAEILNMTLDQVIATRLHDSTAFMYIENAASNGTLSIPVLDYRNNTQNGLHRAMWAKEHAIKKIPVFVFK